MSDPYERTNIFYEEGKEGREETFIELLAKAKAQGEEAYNLVYNLIHSPNPGQ